MYYGLHVTIVQTKFNSIKLHFIENKQDYINGNNTIIVKLNMQSNQRQYLLIAKMY